MHPHRIAIASVALVLCLAGCSGDSADGGATSTGGQGDSGGGANAGGASGGSPGTGRAGTGGGSLAGSGGAGSGSAGSSGADADRDAAVGGERDASVGGNDVYLPWEGGSDYYSAWSAGPPSDPDFFPIAVWLQSPARAADYAAIGVNMFIGLWEGPTEQQLAELDAAGMPALCAQSGVWQAHVADPTILAWTHGDEPDNAQSDGNGGYGPCIPASEIVDGYAKIKANDDTRPVYLNLGQGVANDDWVGRGSCSGTSDYPDYTRGADILSFDVYPVNDGLPLWIVAQGVDRLREWSSHEKAVWNWIETTGIDGPDGKPTPAQVKAEVWMSLVHGSMGIGYFAHVFGPDFIEAGLLADAEMSDAVAAINAQIMELAPALNTPSLAAAVTVESSSSEVPVDFAAKRLNGVLYVFAVGMREGETTATFSIEGAEDGSIEVLGEARTLPLTAGAFEDGFAPYAVHLYRVQ